MKININMVICVITLACLLFNTIKDIRSHRTNTVSIYLGCALIGLLQLYQMYPEGALTYLNYLASVLFMVLLLAGTKHLLGDRIGGGDYDILLLLYLATDWMGFFSILIASSMAAILVTVPLLLAKMITLKTRWPCVPFFFVGYSAYLILGVIVG